MIRTTKLVFSIALGMGSALAIGCSDEAQMERAADEVKEEQHETEETVTDAEQDGILTPAETEEIQEESEETNEAVGEAAEQLGDLIEERTD